jgi:ribose 5-phosphate isomerase B
MRIALAADHGGFDMKEQLIERLRKVGHEVIDFGASSSDPSDDYPDFVVPLARAVADGEVERGIVICGSGVGASVAVNKVKGIRAGLCHDHYSVRQGVEDDNMNVLCLGGRVMGIEVAWDHAQTFTAAAFPRWPASRFQRLRRIGGARDAHSKLQNDPTGSGYHCDPITGEKGRLERGCAMTSNADRNGRVPP